MSSNWWWKRKVDVERIKQKECKKKSDAKVKKGRPTGLNSKERMNTEWKWAKQERQSSLNHYRIKSNVFEQQTNNNDDQNNKKGVHFFILVKKKANRETTTAEPAVKLNDVVWKWKWIQIYENK